MTEYEKGFHDGFEKAKNVLSSKISACINNCELATSKRATHKCCLCGRQFNGEGNNPAPLVHHDGDVCCDECNANVVVPLRLLLFRLED